MAFSRRTRRNLAVCLCGLSWSGVSLAGEPVAAAAVPVAEETPAVPVTEEAPEAPSEPAVDPETRKVVAVVERLHEALLGVMQQAETLGYRGRYEKLEPVLFELFDLGFMAEKSVGRHWKTASEQDQAALVDTFSRFSVANYAGRFHGYTGQSFQTGRVEDSARGTKLVRTTLIDPGGDDVQLNYRVRHTGGGWRIIDVYLNGTVSELALRRSEYSSLIKREGFQALLAALDERIDSLASAPADQAG